MLRNCIKKLGKQISSADRAELEDAFNAHTAKGLSEYEASMAALTGYHKNVFDAVNELRVAASLKPVEYKAYAVSQTELSKLAVNESPETMRKKAEMVNQAKVPVMLYNPGQEVLPHRKGLVETKTKVGTFVHDPSKVSAQQIEARVADGSYHELLGITEPKSPATDRVVTARAPDGTEIESAAVSPANEAAQAKVYQERSPDASIETGTGENVIRDRVALKPLSTGKESTVSTERGTEVKSQYAIVEAADLVTSHDSALNRNPAFPEELQPRERDRAASADQINRIAQNVRPEYLGESPKASEGAPIAGPDGLVESGNGRVLGLRKAYESGKAGDYRQHLLENAEKFGVDPASIKTAKEPVLVRVRQSNVDRAQFVREANEAGVAAMSAPEQAKSDGQRLTGELLSTFSPSESGEINTTANSNFIRAFMRDVVGPNELGRYVSGKGEVSQEGLTRIRNAIFARAYGDSPEGLRALEKLAESPDNNVRNITTALLQRAGQFASLKEGIAKGERYPLDVTTDLSKALAKLSNLREREMSVKDYLNQGDLFGADLTPLQKQALWAFDEYKRSTKAVSAILDNYARGAEAAGNPKQANFFGNETPQKESLFDAAVREAVEDGNRQVGLFATANQRAQVEPEARQRVPSPDTAVQEGAGKAVEVKERDVEPDFIRQARERTAKREADKAEGIEYRRSGADPYELIDNITIKGWELYSQKVKPTFAEWSRKIREEFGPDSERHLRRVWAQLGGEKTTERPTTSVKNAATEELRNDLGLLEIEAPERKSFQQSIDNALAKGLDKKAESIADDVINGKKADGINDEEAAGIQHRMRELENRYEELHSKDKGNPELATIEATLDRLTEATKKGGTEIARSLAFRRSAIDKDFKLISLIQQAKEAYGRDLTGKERSRYEEIVRERDKAVAERDTALEQLHARRLQQELDKATRARTRTTKKETLDQEAALIRQNIVAEFARLKSQQGNIHSMGGLGGLDPEGVITRNLLRYARNRAEATVGLKAEALIDDAHSLVSDFGITRRQVAEALSGYGRLPVDKRGEAARQLAAIRSEINSMLSAEDITAGRRTLKQQGPKRDLVRNQKRFDQLVKQEAEWERKFNERDFEPKPKAEPYPYNSEVRKAEDRVRIAEARFKREMQRAAPGHGFRNASGVLKAWLLSGPPTQAMNIAGTGSYQIFREVARLPAAIGDIVWSQTGARAFGNKGQRSITGPSPSAMLDSIVQAGKVGGRDFLEIMKHGATKEQMERHQYQEIDFGVNTGKKTVDNGVKIIELAHNGIFRFMSGSDRVFYQGAYKRNLIDRATVQAKNEGVSDVRARAKELVDSATDQLAADAKHDGLVSTFNNNNWLSTKIKRARSAVVEKESLMSKKSAERLNAAENFALDFILPFDRTPTNVVSRIVEASPLGYGKNAIQLVAAAMRKSMPVEHQRQMMQTFGNATAGSALMGLGWYLGDQAKELIEVEKYDVYLKIPGLPRINLRTASPAGNVLAVGARMRVEHDKGDASLGDYAKPALRESLNTPILRAASPITEIARDPERTAPKTAARFASMAVPFGGAVRWAGRVTDPAENRFPDSSFKQQFQKGIPIWRQSLPESTDKLSKEKYTEAYRKKEISSADLDNLVRENKISRSDADAITKAGGMSDFQYRFSNLQDASRVLDRYESMDERQRFQVKEIMAKKAWTMTRSDAYTETEKADFKKRIEALGIQEQNPKERKEADPFKAGSSSFKPPAFK